MQLATELSYAGFLGRFRLFFVHSVSQCLLSRDSYRLLCSMLFLSLSVICVVCVRASYMWFTHFSK